MQHSTRCKGEECSGTFDTQTKCRVLGTQCSDGQCCKEGCSGKTKRLLEDSGIQAIQKGLGLHLEFLNFNARTSVIDVSARVLENGCSDKHHRSGCLGAQN